jgi:hypothetical protein
MSAFAQQAWTFLHAGDGHTIQFTDVVVLDDGYLAAGIHHGGVLAPHNKSYILQLDENGDLGGTIRLWNDTVIADVTNIVSDLDGIRYHAVGRLKQDDNRHWAHAVQVMAGPVAIDSSALMCPPLEIFWVTSADMDGNGDLLIAGLGKTAGSMSITDETQVFRLNNAGDSLSHRSINGGILLRAKDIKALSGDSVLLACTGGFAPTPSVATYLYLTGEQLAVVDTFPGNVYNGQGDEPSAFNVAYDALHVIPWEEDQLFINGCIGSLNVGYSTVIHRTDMHGVPSAHFRPTTEFFHNYPATFQSSALTVDGDVLLAMEANFVPVPALPYAFQAPNRIHIYKLDTDLNLICTHVVDGFEDNHYYRLNRIKATDDGGYLLIGARTDLSQPLSHFEGWIRKFSEADCFTSIPEYEANATATVFPNPGIAGCTIVLNGAMHQGARVELLDGTGKLVRSAAMQQNMVELEAQGLA